MRKDFFYGHVPGLGFATETHDGEAAWKKRGNIFLFTLFNLRYSLKCGDPIIVLNIHFKRLSEELHIRGDTSERLASKAWTSQLKHK